MNEVKVRVVDCYIYRHTLDGIRFLLMKRNLNKIYEHLWQGVAGKIEKGETSSEAAIRELKEETGLSPLNIFVADHVSKFYETHGDRINLVPVFGIEVDSENVILSEEHISYKWVDIDEAIETLVWNGQKKGIQTVNDMVINNDDRMIWSKVEFNK
ncbi:MAG: NUDIX pyrophosphatase [Candidatus Marinimicrobia bacterium]|jgi:dATP pyrophosphohydrolase|nr:NUDIX pyrophosphatase [Candidatus Neomarinimicrobiota bacterium]MBT4317585.1 NUDIX pyrophosphatase [Candidatus Neomarinimicrobiota bacterium]MBT4785014.1 NUDIX pyrophosphatase [Candidatus Neomarinimicrobiota bacterium]MBT5097427.1 NUDIX pyrophosphatase [Candidatus Neomarinimicrobiota bacterium]MBT7423050.1 NUDIX pyrophosphatase [Candidatus Neomarinimicrobiota bacterium]|tara:strand:- start:172 stop:639 length:468 start_codon:yes stop_codon:yes gene_type:complete